MDRTDGKPGILVGLQMIPWRKGQLGPGHRQAEVALVLMIEASTRLLDVATAVVLLDEVEVMPQHVSRRHAPATDHERDRQREGFESDGRSGEHGHDGKCLVW
jgi:hypothetical protein